MKKFLCLFALLPVMCAAQATSGFHRVNQVITRSNSGTYAQVVPSASVFVQNTNTGLAAVIYSDALLTKTIPSSLITTDVNGNYNYYLPLNTCVTETISSPSQGSLIVPNICGNAGLSLPLATLNGGTGTTTAPLPTQILVGQTGSAYLPETMIGDCTLSSSGAILCLKTNGVPFTSAATTPLGTSGVAICLLSSACTWGQNQTFSGSSAAGTYTGIYNTTGKNWSLQSQGSSASDPGSLDVVDTTDSTTILSLSSTAITTPVPISIAGSLVCTATNGVCVGGSGTVTSFTAPSGSWPTWLVPTVTNSTTTPSLAVAASPIPNAALANSSITINSITCTLGSTCATGGTSRTCNANGCYFILADGTIEEWGAGGSCGSGGSCSTSITFPFPFTTTANLRVVTALSAGPNNWNTTAVSISTTGFSLGYGPLVFVGGSGANLDGTERASWFAVGN